MKAYPLSDGSEDGMDLRDHFASHIISGCSNNIGNEDNEIEDYAFWSYRVADAMIKARAKTREAK